MAAITIQNLTKSYGGDAEAALSGLTLNISANQFITLLGPSGCGKTTTLRAIAGYIVPDKGSIHVDGRLVSSPEHVVPPDSRGMGMVFQNYAVWPHKTVFENVVFGLKIRKTPTAQARKMVERALDLVGLQGFERRYPNELSGGQQQRVALARSLVVEPKILLLDEPLSNLDAKLRERMRSELKQLQRRTGITFIYVTHDQAEALALSDQIAVMHQGRLQQYGTPFEVYAHPASRIVADFMGLVNIVPGTLADVAQGRGRVEGPDLRLEMAMPDWARSGAAIEIAIRPENIQLQPATATGAAPQATVTERTFLGNINEYHATLSSGQVLRVQTHPLQQFSVGDSVTIDIDVSQCSIFVQQAALHTSPPAP